MVFRVHGDGDAGLRSINRAAGRLKHEQETRWLTGASALRDRMGTAPTSLRDAAPFEMKGQAFVNPQL